MFFELIKRRGNFEPIQYITKVQPFYNTKVFVEKGVLIPRCETEFIVEEAIKFARSIEKPKIADLGCGSGAITKALFLEIRDATIIAVDISLKAISYAKENLKEKESCLIVNGNFCKNSFLKDIDIIVCNPPYLTDEEFKKLPKEIKDYEPKEALFTKEGFYFYKKAILFADNSLKRGGIIIFELGSYQAKRHLLFNQISPHFEVILKVKDYGRKLRGVVLKKIV